MATKGVGIGSKLQIVVAVALFGYSMAYFDSNYADSKKDFDNQVLVNAPDSVPRSKRSLITFDTVAQLINLGDTFMTNKRVKRSTKEGGLLKSKYIAAEKVKSKSITSEKIFADMILGDKIFANKLIIKGTKPISKSQSSTKDEKKVEKTEKNELQITINTDNTTSSKQAPIVWLSETVSLPKDKDGFVHDRTGRSSGVSVVEIKQENKIPKAKGQMMNYLFPDGLPSLAETEDISVKKEPSYLDKIAKLLGNSDDGSIKAKEIQAKNVKAVYTKAKLIDADKIKSTKLFTKYLIVHQKKNKTKGRKPKRSQKV